MSTLIAYLCGRIRSRSSVFVGVSLNLLILGFFKYYNFFARSFADLITAMGFGCDDLTLTILLPVGISFYTFMSISYIVDVGRGKVEAEKDIFNLGAYMGFFPQLLAGPIGRANESLSQYKVVRHFCYPMAVDGCRQALWGFAKKIIVADGCSRAVAVAYARCETLPGSYLAVCAILYSFQIYADFSGYSDIAIGVGKLFGVRLKKNFDFPYFATDISGFWRRWHISLTTWFRDYVYIPLGGNRCSKLKQLRNIFIVFLLSGLWHGANWTFVFWGFIHACFFIPLLCCPALAKPNGSIRDLVRAVLVFFAVTIAWIFFRASSIPAAFSYIAGLCSPSIFSWHSQLIKCVGPLACCLGMVVVEYMQRKTDHGLSRIPFYRCIRWLIYIVLVLATLSSIKTVSEFVYFQF